MIKRLGPLVLILCAAWIAFRFTRDGTTHLVYDDAFYYFTIARNLARGLGSTFDGLHPTNGYHPLWLAVCALPYLVGLEDDAAVRALLVAQVLGLGASALVLLDAFERRAGHALIGAGLIVFVFSPYAFVRLASGLESTLVALFFALLLAKLDGLGDALWAKPRERVIVSLLACGLFLARTDGIFLIPMLFAVALVRARKLRPAIEIALAPALAVALYLLANQISFGTPTQVSGDLKRVTPSLLALLSALATVAAPLAIIAFFARARPLLLSRTTHFLISTAPLAGYVACVMAYYEHMQRVAWPWYYAGPTLYAGTLAAVALSDVFALRLRAVKPVMAAVIALVVIASVKMALGLGQPEQHAIGDANARAGRWMRERTPKDAIFASWDAGAIGYYSRRKVVNLDGEVSPPAYIRALKAGDPKLWTRGERFDYIVNVGDAEDGENALQRIAASYLGEDRVTGATLIESWPFVFHGYTNRHAPGAHPMAVYLMRLP